MKITPSNWKSDTTQQNYGLFQIETIFRQQIEIYLTLTTLYHIFNPFPNKPRFLCVCTTSLLKSLWETEKLLVTSNFSFSPSVFYPFREFSAIFIKFEIVVCKLFQFGNVNNLWFGKRLKSEEDGL